MDVEYNATTLTGKKPVLGFQIGRFSVRRLGPGDRLSDPSGNDYLTRSWILDHIPTGIALLTFDSFEDAVRIADDVSRFSVRDPDTEDVKQLTAQIGQDLIAWLSWVNRNNKAIDYRKWRQQACTTPST